jgi:MerR family transcriptional regulator, light-induced transcriptional regulator
LGEVGRMWTAGEINIAEEHLASTITRRVMAQMMAHATVRPSNGKTFVAAAVAGNQHDIGVEVVSYFFEMDGWRVIPLGANVPIEDLVQAIGFFNADLIGLSVSLPAQLPALRETIQALRRSARGVQVKILAGGGGLAGVSELAQEFGADAYAADPVHAVALGHSLIA